MRTLIIEDERAAVNNLKALLTDVAPQCEMIGITDSIIESIKWLRANPMPELIFMDIHLADGSAFEIFGHILITCPIIFTTAYDEYALRAFKVNSIDYLLKPIGEKDIQRAMEKLDLLTENKQSENPSLAQLIESMSQQKQYKNYFLIPNKGSKLLPLATESIACFHIDNGVVKATTKKNDSFIIPYTLEELIECLDPKHFFRANRQYIIAKDAVTDIDYWFNGRLSVNLIVQPKDKILITKSRVGEFKEWFN
ncbi:DNA-binding LytR/AlgR family response regulator [Parabacteroides sp. PF5-5]|uniref:LytR/AlgR family response regulator transcription factor n=1 Tax=unclassified Parabacteroides TaxID=2649774 RepID=UPI0024758FCC|nr:MULTISPECIES: LytTR family DNA-binding domain-containing protein [unclassified Parabacteroides]MDH6303692.1 DNA-binding LytR/AlgR family response regulator [Parabacteroides sp. PH5-39]MDH6314309.1 DNA-binding LytR/AlgR family response regulator [Parabacteroides sp. PF5-13]MDH6318627.1 DNA-binding LytR/AlgR family response regulator [Parabacteroides sp. PH5-13]MDH6322081.1 DNA-binding LytR/AlgR family response regulator [Parabacteroides sp. PH5-8]MDH6325840.1 DNA-binding LytR/AlgR family res